MKHQSAPPHQKASDQPLHQHTLYRKVQIKPKPVIFRLLYKTLKYGTLLTVATFIILTGILFLGDSSISVDTNRQIFDLYQNSQNTNKNLDRINSLFNKQSSKYISKKAINFYLNQETEKISNDQNINHKFQDLSVFADYLISQRYEGQNVLYLPLSLNQEKSNFIIPESYTSRLLTYIKKNLEKTLQKLKITQPSQAKQTKSKKTKKVVENGKTEETNEQSKDNILDIFLKWIKSQPSVIVLTVDNEWLHEKNNKMKKVLNKWIKDKQDDSEIIILSHYPLNILYDVKEEDYLKSYHFTSSIDSIEDELMCNYLKKHLKIIQANCLTVRSRFSSLSQLEQFVEAYENDHPTSTLVQQSKQAQEVLSEVCEKGQVKYYFYKNQENINKVLGKTKKGKKSRLDRELQALIVKWSHLKKSFGLNKLKDMYLTVTSGDEQGQKLSLREANELGLYYDFDSHVLKWNSEEDRLEYEISTVRRCKDGNVDEQRLEEVSGQVQESAVNEEVSEQQEQQEQEQKVQEQEQVVGVQKQEEKDVSVEREENKEKAVEQEQNAGEQIEQQEVEQQLQAQQQAEQQKQVEEQQTEVEVQDNEVEEQQQKEQQQQQNEQQQEQQQRGQEQNQQIVQEQSVQNPQQQQPTVAENQQQPKETQKTQEAQLEEQQQEAQVEEQQQKAMQQQTIQSEVQKSQSQTQSQPTTTQTNQLQPETQKTQEQAEPSQQQQDKGINTQL